MDDDQSLPVPIKEPATEEDIGGNLPEQPPGK
jgi:hypothetical protein